jgi:hypothetical protein
MEEIQMRIVRELLAFPLMLLTIAASPAFADQQHLVAPGQLAATVTDHVAHQDASRAAIREALARPEVRDVASSMHIDLARATAAVETMTGADLEQTANAAKTVNQQLVGGASTVVISTTTIIIALLVLIILIVALK